MSFGRGEPDRPTLLRVLIAERHWQRFQAFEAQFRRAALDLAEREALQVKDFIFSAPLGTDEAEDR
jgi:hypothetical protein